MKQIYHKYNEWEDFKNGMYNTEITDESLVIKAVELLSNESEFYFICLKVLDNWKISSDVNLSNTSNNRRAWIGQASCNYKHGTTEILTREAWSRLDTDTRTKANKIADKIIRIYETRNRRLYQNVGTKMLF